MSAPTRPGPPWGDLRRPGEPAHPRIQRPWTATSRRHTGGADRRKRGSASWGAGSRAERCRAHAPAWIQPGCGNRAPLGATVGHGGAGRHGAPRWSRGPARRVVNSPTTAGAWRVCGHGARRLAADHACRRCAHHRCNPERLCTGTSSRRRVLGRWGRRRARRCIHRFQRVSTSERGATI